MASEVTEDPQLEVDDATEQEAAPKKSLLSSKKVKILALLALVMSVEAAGFFLLVPDGNGGNQKDEEPIEEDLDTVEVTVLKNYRTTNHIAAPGVVTDVTFTLVAEVPSNESVTFDLAVTKDKANLIKSEVQKVILGSNSEELHDPSLTVISQKIREAINKALRKSYVTRVLLVNWNTSPR